MISKKHLIYIILAFSIAFSVTFFIIKSNDHKECETITKKIIDENGQQVITEEHICKEKYSF